MSEPDDGDVADDLFVVFYLKEHLRTAMDQQFLTRNAVQVSTGGDSTPKRPVFKIQDGGPKC